MSEHDNHTDPFMSWFSELDVDFVENTEALFVKAELEELDKAVTELHHQINLVRGHVDKLDAHASVQLYSWPMDGGWMRVLLSPTYEQGGTWKLGDDGRARYWRLTTNREYVAESGRPERDNKEYFVDFQSDGMRAYAGVAYVEDGTWRPRGVCPPLIQNDAKSGPDTHIFSGYSSYLPRPLDNASIDEVREIIQYATEVNDILALLGPVTFDAKREYRG